MSRAAANTPQQTFSTHHELSSDYITHIQTLVKQLFANSTARADQTAVTLFPSQQEKINPQFLRKPTDNEQYAFVNEVYKQMIAELERISDEAKEAYRAEKFTEPEQQMASAGSKAGSWLCAAILSLPGTVAASVGLTMAPRGFGSCEKEPGHIDPDSGKVTPDVMGSCSTLGFLGLIIPVGAIFAAVATHKARSFWRQREDHRAQLEALNSKIGDAQIDEGDKPSVLRLCNDEDRETVTCNDVSALIRSYEGYCALYEKFKNASIELISKEAELEQLCKPPAYESKSTQSEDTPLLSVNSSYDHEGAQKAELKTRITELKTIIKDCKAQLQPLYTQLLTDLMPELGTNVDCQAPASSHS